jgi:hypothetical protein
VSRLRQEEWGVPRAVAVGALVAPFAGGAVVALLARDERLFRLLVREDSLIEWLEVVAWAIALVASVVVARRERGWMRLAWILFAVGCVLALGEELSWGQRLAGFGTPEALRDSDKQEEATLHNLRELEAPTEAAVLVVAATLAVAPWITRRVPVFLAGAFAFTAAYELSRLVLGDQIGYRFAKYGEWPELCLAAALAGLTVCTARRVESRACLTS